MEAKATVKYVRTSPRKMRRTVDLIRGQHVGEAKRILRLSTMGASRDVEKLLDSAIANAEQRPGVIAENLLVSKAWVDEGPTLRRFRPRAYGRATRVRKRTSHVTLVAVNASREDLGQTLTTEIWDVEQGSGEVGGYTTFTVSQPLMSMRTAAA